MDILLVPLLLLIKAVIGIAIMITVADVVLSWLMAANIFNSHNRFVYAVIDTVSRLSGLMLDPIRKWMPVNIGMLDISPVVLLLLLALCENMVNRILLRFC
ncbi:MAG: YggT family protein [Holosporaceae bacterium]|jgi:YggT family protein|nr:YggT family protein [Holosporaceae bacterium]